jgi:hypothetical protein
MILTSDGINYFGSGIPASGSVNIKNTAMSGLLTPLPPSSSQIVDISHVNYRGVDQKISNMFLVPAPSQASGTQGRYIFIGWIRSFNPSSLTDYGKTLLQRALNWAYCGNVAC